MERNREHRLGQPPSRRKRRNSHNLQRQSLRDLDGRRDIRLWLRNIEKEYGNLALQFGYSSSPLLYEGRLYVIVIRRDSPYRAPPADGPLDSFIAALDPKTGQTLWKQQRKTNAFDEGMETYSTPTAFVRTGKCELLTTRADFIT